MVEELSNLVVRVKTVAQEVGSSATHTSEQMTELVQIADKQLQQIAAAARQAEQMAQSGRRAAERIQVLDGAANAARMTAQSGRQSMLRTVTGMERINANVQETATQVMTLEDRSREINEVVEAISGIAHLTNRLALDAAIQAAMAGENGKGFRAIADDIRRLAERAKDQAGLITQIVRCFREDIGTTTASMQDAVRETSEGTELVRETGTAFEHIYNVVETQAQEIETISQMVRILLRSASAVVQITQDVSISTQQASASTRDVSSNMGVLAERAEQFLGSVEAFKLRDDTFSPPQTAFNDPMKQIGD